MDIFPPKALNKNTYTVHVIKNQSSEYIETTPKQHNKVSKVTLEVKKPWRYLIRQTLGKGLTV